MFKKLLSSLSMVALLFTACKKSDMIPGTEENQRTITSNPTEPVAVVSPTVFFVENDALFSVSNIAAATPTVTYKGIIPGIQIFDPITKSNVFNNHETITNGMKNSLYNPFTDQILSGQGNVLSKCLTTKLGTTTVFIDAVKSNFLPLAVNPVDKKLYYFCIIDVINNGELPKESFQIRSVNMDGTNDTKVCTHSGGVIPFQNTCDIDFKTSSLYTPSTKGIYRSDLVDGASLSLFLPAISANETMSFGEVKFDAVHNTIFFSTTLEKEKRKRIWRIDASGNKASLKLITSIAFTDPAVTFSFDISPKTNTVFVCKRELTALNQHHSTIMRVNMDGTGSKIIKTGGYINTIVVAEPIL